MVRASTAALRVLRQDTYRRSLPRRLHGQPAPAILVFAHGAWGVWEMARVDEEGLNQLVAAVRAHYARPNAPPLLLSSFGQRNKDLVARLKEGFGSLKAAVRAAGEHRIRFIDQTVGSEAVAPAERAVDLEQQLQEATASQRQAAMLFDTLPRSVQLAFCVRTEPAEHLALDVVRPFRFSKVTAPDLIRPVQRLIPDRFRSPGVSLRSASVHEKHDLWKQFAAWAESVGIDPETFRGGETSTALSRLLAAQPADVVPRLVIPGDILQLLMRHS